MEIKKTKNPKKTKFSWERKKEARELTTPYNRLVYIYTRGFQQRAIINLQ